MNIYYYPVSSLIYVYIYIYKYITYLYIYIYLNFVLFVYCNVVAKHTHTSQTGFTFT